MTTRHEIDEMVAWQRLLLAAVGDISYRLASRQTTPVFYRETAENLENLASRIRRQTKE